MAKCKGFVWFRWFRLATWHCYHLEVRYQDYAPTRCVSSKPTGQYENVWVCCGCGKVKDW